MIIELKEILRVPTKAGVQVFRRGKYCNYSSRRNGDSMLHRLHLWDPITKGFVVHVEVTKPEERPSWL